MAVLVLLRGAVIAVLIVFGAGVVAEDAVIAGNLVCQARIGQAIQRAIQRDAVHLDQFVLHVLMR
ncbi:hypothetical protein D3C81_1862450 [compost metagenome]